jgi:uncharacterized protein YqgV (UPF0045/DUF77 family)
MLADLSIIPVSGTPHTSGILAKVLTLIEGSGLRYQLTPTATCLEGTWAEISEVARRCHNLARNESSHVVTLLRFEDDGKAEGKLLANTAAVEQKAGREFPQSPGEAMTEPAKLSDLVGLKGPSKNPR